MIEFVKVLEEKGIAYNVDGNVYFDITKAKDYGKLSKKNIDDLRAGARIDISDEKKNPLDFALWKKRKDESEPAWESPWGMGRPGWHLECSVMAKKYLGDTIDIHAGGEDLQFPHHENEIAQSECCNGKVFANYWMHNGMINIDNVKMSKSKGNFFTIKDIQKEYRPLLRKGVSLESLYEERFPLYKEVADFHILNKGRISEVIDEIQEKIKQLHILQKV